MILQSTSRFQRHASACPFAMVLVLLAAVPLVLATRVHAQGAVTYDVNVKVGTDSVTGEIVTDGTSGVLGSANILSWNLDMFGAGVVTNLTSAGGQSGILLVGGDLTATATSLSFNYSGTDNGYFVFQASSPGFYSGAEYWCNNTTWYGCSAGASIVPQTYTDATAQYGTNVSGSQVIGSAATVAPPPPPPSTSTYSGSVLLGANNNATTGSPPCTAGDPVNCATGNLIETQTDLQVFGRGRMLSLVRTFNGLDAAAASSPHSIGFGWVHSYAAYLTIDSGGNVTVHRGNGATVSFTKSGSTFTAPAFVIASLVQNSDSTYTFRLPSQEADIFSAAGRLITQTDRNGYKTLLAYDGVGNLLSVTDSAGRALSFSYQANGLLASVTDPIGRKVSYGYDSSLNLIGVTDAGGHVTRYAYDGSHRLTSMARPNGGLATHVYDGNNRVVSQTDAAGRNMTFAYGSSSTTITDGDGHVTVQTYTNNRLTTLARGVNSPAAATWTFTYDGAGNRNSGTDPNGNTWNATYDARGNRLTLTDALGRTTTNTFDARNDRLTRTDPSGVTINFAYDANGNLLQLSSPLTATSQTWTQTFKYGDPGHPGDVTAMVDANGAIWTRAYDVDGDVIRRVDPVNDLWTGSYNGIGWLVREVMPRGNAQSDSADFAIAFVYSPQGQTLQTTDQLGNVTKYAYDADDNLMTKTDANGHITSYAYDPDDELIKTTRADGTVLATSFDQAGNMLGQTDGLGRKTSYTYDALNRRIAVSDPLGRSTQFGYDGAGNPISKTDAGNQKTSLTYDAANELTGIAYSDGMTPPVSFAYDLDGQRKAMRDGTGSSAYQFDSLHRLTSVTDGAGNHIGYEYDLRGSLTGIIYPSGKAVTRGFDGAGRLISVSDWLGNRSGFQYDPDGDSTGIRYGNGVNGAFTYDRADRVASMDYGFMHFFVIRDKLGLVTRNDSGGREEHRDQENRDYAYNSINELSDSGAESFGYDAADNITRAGFAALSYDVANELINDSGNRTAALTYDARGNRLSARGNSQYHYDQENRLTGIDSESAYIYDGDGLRTRKVVSGVSMAFTWDRAEQSPLLLTDGTTQFIYGAQGLPLEQVNPDGSVLWFHQDQIGSTRALTDGHRNVVAHYDFNAYGRRRDEDQWDFDRRAATPLLFAGQYTDLESGLQYLRARYYDPRTGQFLTRDPKASLTRSPYLYASGDPINHTDPSGAQDGDVGAGPDPVVLVATGSGGGGDTSGGSCSIDPSNYVEVAGLYDSVKGFFTFDKLDPQLALTAIDATDANGNDPAFQKLKTEVTTLLNSGLDPTSWEFKSKLADVYSANAAAVKAIQPAATAIAAGGGGGG